MGNGQGLLFTNRVLHGELLPARIVSALLDFALKSLFDNLICQAPLALLFHMDKGFVTERVPCMEAAVAGVERLTTLAATPFGNNMSRSFVDDNLRVRRSLVPRI